MRIGGRTAAGCRTRHRTTRPSKRQRNAHKAIASIECPFTNARYTVRYGYGRDLQVLECITANALNSTIQRKRCNVRTTTKCSLANCCNVSGNSKRCNCCVVSKSSKSKACNTCRNSKIFQLILLKSVSLILKH